MPKLFNAAKTGNLKELKRLKENGVDLGQSDEYGNTPLLWAACYGHLDVVIWLLKQGQSEVTKANKLGNTALLLAASYGQLEVVQWLLSEDQAKYTETNTLDMSPLSLAIISDQLAVVDYLVRNYYLRTNFNFDITSKNKAINYYLKFASLFSQKNVNYSEIQSLIDSASIKLKDNELNYLYCIYLWMDISNQADKLNGLEINTKEIYIDQLLPSLQVELISYMFRKGYVLNCQPINKDKPGPKGLLLNEEQKSAIEKILAQSKQDKYLRSIESESEKLELYSNYYVIPLYRSITCALQIEDTIDKALLAPYSYHASSNQDPIIETNIAQWTAYHLCQTLDVSEQQHVDLYLRTTGPSRLGYYEIIEKCLSDESPLKKSLLKKLGGIADFDGNRLHWVKNYPNWLQEISSKFSKQEPSDQTLKLELIGLDHPIQLKEEVSQILWDSIKHEPNPSVLPGNHPVYKLEEQGLYCKLYPSLPGINDALHYLYRRVFCAFTGLPLSVTGLLTIDNQTIPVLLSQDAGSSIEANDERLEKLDPYTRSKLIVFNIITNLDDAKRENHALQENKRGLYDIYSVDNDQGLVNATTEKGWIFKTPKLSVKSFLFCLDAMKEPLDKKAVDELLSLKPVETLTAWLEDLIKLDEQYESLFKECKDSCANEKDLNRRSYLKMVLPLATLLRIAYKLQRLQILLKDKPDKSPLILLRELEPVVASYYEPYLDKSLSATERFDALVKEEGLYDWCKNTKSYSTTITSGRDVFEALVPDNQPELVRPRVALEIFKSIAKCWETLNQDQVLVMNGEIARFIKLPVQEQQALLKLTRINQFNHLHATSLLEAIAKQTHFTEIYLNHPEATLTNYLFKSILVSNPNLLDLSVTSSKVLTTLYSINGLQFLNKLRLCQLPEVEEFTATLPMLTELTIRGNSKLTQLKLNAPELRRLRIIDCDNLAILDLPQSLKLDDVKIQGCSKLALSEFYCEWPGFISRWSEVPSMFTQRLANCITESFTYSMPELAEPVYNIIRIYLDRLSPLCQKLNEKPSVAFTSAIALAYLGFTNSKVMEILLIGLAHFDSLNLNATGEAICALQEKHEVFINRAEEMLQYTFINAQSIVAAKILSKFKIKNNEIIKKLLELIESNDDLVRLAAAKALIILEDKLTPKVKNCLLLLALYGEEEIARKEAIDLLFSMKITSETVINFYLEGLASKSKFNRMFAIVAATTLPMKDVRIVNMLIDRLNNDMSPNREAAANTLVSLGIKYDYVVQALNKALNDKNKFAQSAAEKVLDSIQKYKVICLSANEIIQIIPRDKEWTIQDILASLTDKDADKRQEAANAASMLQVKDEQVMNGLLNASGDSTFEVRQAAAKALIACFQQPEAYLKPELAELISIYNETREIQVHDNIEEDVLVFSEQKNDNISINVNIPEDKSVILPVCNKQEEDKEHIKHKILDKEYSEILLAAKEGDLDTVKSILSKKNGLTTYITIPKNNSESTALSVAANAGHLLVVDYLIRYHYVGLRFDENEKRALDSFSKDNTVFRHYYDLLTLFSLPSIDIKAFASLLKNLSNKFSRDESSIIYLLYLWMKVSHQANKPPSKMVPMEAEPSMNQLLPAHQTELIHHMIKEGYVLNDWSVNAKELVITDMIFDKKQANALEQLLEQSTYAICIKLPNTVIERDKIYFEINEQGLLQYSVQDINGELKTGVIKELNDKLTAPLTLDQLKSLPSILEEISNNKHIRPEIQALLLNRVRFTKEYQLLQINKILEKNMLYVETKGNVITYSVLTPLGIKVTDTISEKLLREKGVNLKFPIESSGLVKILKPILTILLEITESRGHTVAEHATKGYKNFLALLNNQLIMPNLQTLHLQDCDLYDDFDLVHLYPIVVKRTALIHLNLDYNHITRIGLTSLLESLKGREPQSCSLSVRFNEIEIYSLLRFNDLELNTHSINALQLQGNSIVDDNPVNKIHFKKLVAALYMLFRILPTQASNLTINSFLSATDIDLTLGDDPDYLFHIKIDDVGLKLNLNQQDFKYFDALCFRENEQGKRKEILSIRTPKEQFAYLISGISPMRIRQLGDSLLLPSSSSTKQLCKQLLNYHQDAKLGGKLITHSIFKTKKMDKKESHPSLLFPETRLTLEKGQVYLIANDKGLGKEHSLLGYEYLTGCGQRIFKVAHLTADKKNNKKIGIGFLTENLSQRIIETKTNRLIASYQVDTKKIKKMHADIYNDVKWGISEDKSYERIIMGSLRNDEIMNCLTYCIDKMKEHLGIIIYMGMVDCVPSAVVQHCIEENIKKTNEFENDFSGSEKNCYKK